MAIFSTRGRADTKRLGPHRTDHSNLYVPAESCWITSAVIPDCPQPQDVGMVLLRWRCIFLDEYVVNQPRFWNGWWFQLAQHGKEQSTMGLGQICEFYWCLWRYQLFCSEWYVYSWLCKLRVVLYLAVDSLLKKYNINRRSIGRIEVGTQTIISRGQSVKSHLMNLFSECRNTDIKGLSHMIGYDFYRDWSYSWMLWIDRCFIWRN